MKDRTTWVPSLLSGKLVPKKTSVWDLDDEERERNDGRQATLMETTPYTRPKNYEVNKITSTENVAGNNKPGNIAINDNTRTFQPPITSGSVLPYPFNRIMQNAEKRILPKNPIEQTQSYSNKLDLPITVPNAPRDSISDPNFLHIIEPYLIPNPAELSADTLRSISR